MLSVTETETLAAYMKPPSRYGGGGGAGGADDSSGGPAKGFVVRDAPWNAGNKVRHADLSFKCFRDTLHVLCIERLALPVICVVYQTFHICWFQAPDMSSAEDFPTFGTGVAPKQASAWGPKKF